VPKVTLLLNSFIFIVSKVKFSVTYGVAQNLPFQQILPTLTLLLPLDCFHDHGTGQDLSSSSINFTSFS